MINFLIPIAKARLGYDDLGYHMMDWGGFDFIPMIIFWILIILGILLLIQWGIKHQQGEKGGKTALEILKERYAKGEINKKEFEAMKKDLGN